MITPSRFLGDPLGYAGNQSAHGVMGMFAAMGCMLAGVSMYWAAPLAALIYLVAVEWLPGQIKIDWIDSLDDMAHAWLGAALIVSAGLSFPGGEWSGDWTAPLVFTGWTAFMGWQMWRRWSL